jgi:hypothetical protein
MPMVAPAKSLSGCLDLNLAGPREPLPLWLGFAPRPDAARGEAERERVHLEANPAGEVADTRVPASLASETPSLAVCFGNSCVVDAYDFWAVVAVEFQDFDSDLPGRNQGHVVGLVMHGPSVHHSVDVEPVTKVLR